MPNPESLRESYEIGYGSPEGVEYGPPRIYLDKTNGDVWTKTTSAELNTGWRNLAAVVLVSPPPPEGYPFPWFYYGHGSPEGVVKAAIGSLYTDVDTGIPYPKSADNGGATGWEGPEIV